MKTSGTDVKQINILPGWVEPSDMKEIKRILNIMDINSVMLPDTSDVLDAPMTGKHEFYPKGGTTISELIATGNSKKSLGIGHWTTRDAAIELDNKCKVPFDIVDLPDTSLEI